MAVDELYEVRKDKPQGVKKVISILYESVSVLKADNVRNDATHRVERKNAIKLHYGKCRN